MSVIGAEGGITASMGQTEGIQLCFSVSAATQMACHAHTRTGADEHSSALFKLSGSGEKLF